MDFATAHYSTHAQWHELKTNPKSSCSKSFPPIDTNQWFLYKESRIEPYLCSTSTNQHPLPYFLLLNRIIQISMICWNKIWCTITFRWPCDATVDICFISPEYSQMGRNEFISTNEEACIKWHCHINPHQKGNRMRFEVIRHHSKLIKFHWGERNTHVHGSTMKEAQPKA